MAIVIGIDGGGTKTKALLADELGHVYGTALAGPTNPNSLNRQELEKTIRFIFSQLQKAAPNEFNNVEFCYLGMAGVGEGKTRNALHYIVEEVCNDFAFNYELDNDGVNALFAGTFGKPGMVLVSGTGSIAYGLSRTDEFYRVGGWGYLFDDLGSGYDLGKKALQAVFQAYDGRGKKTKLSRLLLNHFNVESVPEIVPLVFKSDSPRSVIAPLSQLVMDGYDVKDDVSVKLIEETSYELANIIIAMQRKLNINKTSHQVFLTGGLFERANILIPHLKKHINSEVNFKKIEHEPVVGAVVAAFKKISINISDEFKKNIKL